ncbi:DUF433 domain-containing protein [Candidatus Uhrbacteria bacterium]|nr:DUF433 domain-containing protein [Candidatus Uhrbacteria bacterium]
MLKTIAPLITINPGVRFGRPTIKGTRVAVETILAEIAAGMAPTDVAREYRLTRRQVAAALRYALQLIEEERHVAI